MKECLKKQSVILLQLLCLSVTVITLFTDDIALLNDINMIQINLLLMSSGSVVFGILYYLQSAVFEEGLKYIGQSRRGVFIVTLLFSLFEQYMFVRYGGAGIGVRAISFFVHFATVFPFILGITGRWKSFLIGTAMHALFNISAVFLGGLWILVISLPIFLLGVYAFSVSLYLIYYKHI